MPTKDTDTTPMLTKKPYYNSHKDISNEHVPFIVSIPRTRLFGRRKIQTNETVSPAEKPKKESKINSTQIDKFELSDGKLTFFVLSGVFKKRWVNTSEILLTEISHVESNGNLINITRGGAVHRYVYKNKTDSFERLQEQILVYLSEKQATAEDSRKIAALKAELASAINASIPIVDLCFDILMAMNKKRINWSQIDTVTGKLAGTLDFSGQNIASLSIDLSKIPLSVKSQVPKDVAEHVMDVLKTIYAYFDALTSHDSLVENTANVDNAKKALLAYFTVNDVLLAKFTGQKVEDKEISALENVVLALVDKSVITSSWDELNGALSNVKEGELGLAEARTLFRFQLK
jgi:hypothetical protein